MAAVLTPLSVLPNALQYRWHHDGVGNAAVIRTQAQLIEDCASLNPGLKRLLENATTDDAWGKLKLSTSFTQRFGTRRQLLEVTLGVFEEVGRGLRVKSPEGPLNTATVELRMGK